MKVINTSKNEVVNSQDFEKHSFGIKSKNLHYIIGLLRNDLYSDKLLAVIREYSCNAYDANVEAGNADKPVDIVLPTKLEPVFKIRDYGPGLSKKDIIDIFISYAESTKRGTNAQIGQMGIGSKAAFCYSDSFTVTSFHNGIKTVYDCVLDKNDVGDCLVLFSEPTDETDGVEISVNIKMDDVNEFNNKAWKFFGYWSVVPNFVGFNKEEIETNFDKKEVIFSGTNWQLVGNKEGYSRYRYSSDARAVMGNIAYPIDWTLVRLDESLKEKDNAMLDKMLDFVKNTDFVFNFDIGDLQFSPSRESLQYTDHTKQSLLKMVKVVVKEIEQVVKDQIASCDTLLDAYTKYNDAFDYSYLTNLKNYFDGKIEWRGIKIEGSHIDIDRFHNQNGYVKKDPDAGYYGNTISDNDKMFVRYEFKKQTNRLSKDRWNSSQLKIDKDVKILWYDTTKRSYINKAIKHIFNKYDCKLVYVMKFLTTKAKKDAYDKLPLSNLKEMVIKYSDIHEELKKGIVRSPRGSGVSNVVGVGNTEVYVGYHYVDSFYRNYVKLTGEPYRKLHKETVDLSDNTTRYYMRVKDKGFGDTNRYSYFCGGNQNISVENILGSLMEDKVFKTKLNSRIYAINDKIFNSKKFQKFIHNWVPIEDFVNETLKGFLEDEDVVKEMVLKYYKNQLHSSYGIEPWGLKNIVNSLKSKKTVFHSLHNHFGNLTDKFKFINDRTLEFIIENNVGDIKKKKLYKDVAKAYDFLNQGYPLLGYITNDHRYALNVKIDMSDECKKAIKDIIRYIELERNLRLTKSQKEV